MTKYPAKRLLGLDFDSDPLEQVAARIATRPAGAPFAYVVTPNADHLVRIASDPMLAGIYEAAWIRLLDSRVVAGIGALLGLRPPRVVTGSDLAALLLDRYIAPAERICIIGLSPAWLPALIARYDLAPPAHFNPPMDFDRDASAVAEVIDFARANPCRLIFLAVGSPRQEKLAAALREADVTGTGLCIGASLEFLCGARRRAPVAMQRLGLEWLWRLMREPRRLGARYLLASPKVIPLLLRQRYG